MTLRLRLLFATFILCSTAIVVVGLGLRTAWRNAENTRFEQEFLAATRQLEDDLSSLGTTKRALLSPICSHDPLVDSALIGLTAGDLSARVLSLRLRVPELARALAFDELALVADTGEVLAGRASFVPAAEHASELARYLLSRSESASAADGPPVAIVFACVKKRGTRWVGLLGAEHVDSHLRDAETRYGLSLELLQPGAAAPRPSPDRLQQSINVALWKDRLLLASRSRTGLREALSSLDGSVIGISLVALVLASLVAAWLSRGLARPVVAFAERARAAISGTPEPLPLRGGPELVQAARAFNQTLADLAGLRERLEVTERIAARREVARQIAHEIKNPLSPIRASIETLRRLRARGDAEFDGYFDEATKTVLHEVRRIDELVRAFSEYANLPPPALDHFELGELGRELAQLHAGLGAGIELDVSHGTRVLADRNQLSQVVTNLLKNALEATATAATPSHPGRIRVGVRAHDRGDKRWVALSVSDNGPGVPLELITKIFDPYVTTKGHGTGLGLAISRRIAVEHGGDLRLEPGVGPGATFTLELPADGPSTSI